MCASVVVDVDMVKADEEMKFDPLLETMYCVGILRIRDPASFKLSGRPKAGGQVMRFRGNVQVNSCHCQVCLGPPDFFAASLIDVIFVFDDASTIVVESWLRRCADGNVRPPSTGFESRQNIV